ncbi:MAG TPA: MarR family transcriptional regulator [Gemmatimonadales bacterium]|nr:MarR family transcriptional regulator [Gemmatimonadales bacterium]
MKYIPGPDQALNTLLQAAHQWEDRLEAAMASVELSPPKLSVLTELVNAGGALTLGELADRIHCVRSNVTQLMDRLEAEGLVRRANHGSDRRRIRAELTDQGKARQQAGAEQLAKVQQEFAKAFPGPERTALVGALGSGK